MRVKPGIALVDDDAQTVAALAEVAAAVREGAAAARQIHEYLTSPVGVRYI